jgi:DNA gyrase subunit A
MRWSTDADGLFLVTAQGMLVRIAADSINSIGRNTQGVRLANLKTDDRLIAVARVVDSDDDSADLAAGGDDTTSNESTE